METELHEEASRNTYGDDHEITDGIRRQDPQALELLYDRLARQAFGLAHRILDDGPLAEDVVQDAFLALWRMGDRLSAQRGSVSSLLMTMVHHKSIDLIRRRRRQLTRDGPIEESAFALEAESDVAQTIIASLDKALVRKALLSLPDEQRTAIELAYFKGLTHVEIAKTLALPLGTVKSRLRLGLERMRINLKSERF